MKFDRVAFLVAAVGAAACATPELDPPPEVIHARFDPDEKVIPMPTDVLRDEALGRLDIPIEDDLTAAEADLYSYMNGLDGWSSAMAATVEFTAPVAPESIHSGTLQVWKWGAVPERVDDVRLHLSDDGMKVTIDAPREGWERGERYVAMLRGGAAGAEGAEGEVLVADAAFYFLRLTERLDVPEHERAFPGDDAEERQENASDLEEIRVDLAPHFDFFEGRGIAREEIAALWAFTVTERVELAMDKASQRIPLPIGLAIDPATGKVDLPVAEWDDETTAHAKERLRELDGFATSGNLLFSFTGPVDPATVTPETVELYRVGDSGLDPVEVTVEVLADGESIEVTPAALLDEKTTYAVVVRDGILDTDGRDVVTMPLGAVLRSRNPAHDGTASTLGPVEDEDAVRAERVRGQVESVLDQLGRDRVLTAWTFTTLTVEDRVREYMDQPAALGVDPDPTLREHMTPVQAAADFPLASLSLWSVGDVYHGTIDTPVFLDPVEREMRADGGYTVQPIPFTMSVPADIEPGQPLPVVIFGHGLMTERRFVLALADALASRGFAAIAIDLPFHGERSYCKAGSFLTVPDPTTGELTEVTDQCEGDATCSPDGVCRTASGEEAPLTKWPIVGMPQATGAAFIEFDNVPNSRDHILQSLIDLAALKRSLADGDWESMLGVPLETDRVFYAGQSLGGILGATFVALSPEIERAVLNVPGADLLDLIDNSPMFRPQVDAFLKRVDVTRESYDGHLFLNVARWFTDLGDPQGVAHLLDPERVLIQMATLDFIIPNPYTETLHALSGVPKTDYVAEHAFLVIPVEPAYLPGLNELADFLAEGL